MQIIILPGLDGTGTLLSEITESLSAHHDVTSVPYPITLSTYDDLLPLVQNALPQDDFVIVAESFSGPLAVMAAAQQPVRLKGVFLVATFAKSPRSFPRWITPVLRRLPLTSSLFAWLSQPVLMGKWRNAAFLKTYKKAIKQVPPKTIADRVVAVRNVDVRGLLADVTVPMAYLGATSDRLVPATCAQDFQVADKMHVQIAGPHFLLQANAKGAATHILRFVANLKAP